MSLTAPQKAVMLAAQELAPEGFVRFTPETLLEAARRREGGARADHRTIGSLRKRCLLARDRFDHTLVVTEAGRVRLREGL